MSINIIQDQSQELTTLRVTGSPTLAEMIETLEWLAENRTRLIMWDMSDSDMSQAPAEDVRRFVERAVELGRGKTDGRTAVVAPGDLEFGFARMSGSLTDVHEADYTFSAFRTTDEALAWLQTPAHGRDD